VIEGFRRTETPSTGDYHRLV